MGTAVIACAVVVAAGAAVAMTGGQDVADEEWERVDSGGDEDFFDDEGWEAQRRAELKNLAEISGEPITEEQIQQTLEDERQFPQTVQDLPAVPDTEDTITNVIEGDR